MQARPSVVPKHVLQETEGKGAGKQRLDIKEKTVVGTVIYRLPWKKKMGTKVVYLVARG